MLRLGLLAQRQLLDGRGRTRDLLQLRVGGCREHTVTGGADSRTSKIEAFRYFAGVRGGRSLRGVPEFLVEFYVSRPDAAAVDSGAQRARAGAEELTREGTPVRYLRSIFVPEDETCFFLYDGASADAVREAATRAGLPFERVAGVITSSSSGAPSVQRRPK